MFPEFSNELVDLSLAVVLDLVVSMILIQRLQASQLLTTISRYSLLLFNMLILFLCFTLSQQELSFGAGLGLFALLAILRFRSEVMRIDELIGLLLLLGLGFIHAIFPSLLNLATILLVDVVLVVITTIMAACNRPTVSMKIKLHDLALVHQNKRLELNKLLEGKIGLAIHKIEMGNVHLEDGTACLHVTFYEKENKQQEKVKPIKNRFSKNFGRTPVFMRRYISQPKSG